MLEEEGYSVVAEVGDGQQAVDQAQELRPDLVILDIQMPVLDGLSAAEQIASARLAPVIVLTAFSQRELVERARDAGAMAYLVKPFSKNDLVPAIEVARARFTEMAALDNEVRTLEERLETRKVVEKAKGLLMAEQGITEAEAFRWIQRTAMNQRTSMKGLAQSILDAGAAADAGGDGATGGTTARTVGPARAGFPTGDARFPVFRTWNAEVTTSSRSMRCRVQLFPWRLGSAHRSGVRAAGLLCGPVRRRAER